MAYGENLMRSSTHLPGAVGSSLRSVAAPNSAVDSFNGVVTPDEVGALDDRYGELLRLRTANARLINEVAELRMREAAALRLADRDGLTGLYNRRCMLELMNSVITEAVHQRQLVGLLFVDLNGFKAVNDLYGHAAGDRILTTVAARISARTRAGDIVCRYGGDEFVVVLPNLPDSDCLVGIADAVRDRIALPYWLKGREQHLSAAIGKSIYPFDGVDAETLLHHADQHMYEIKSGRERSSSGAGVPPALDRRRNDKSTAPGGGDL